MKSLFEYYVDITHEFWKFVYKLRNYQKTSAMMISNTIPRNDVHLGKQNYHEQKQSATREFTCAENTIWNNVKVKLTAGCTRNCYRNPESHSDSRTFSCYDDSSEERKI